MASYNVEINYLNENNEYDQLIPFSLPRGIINLWYGAVNEIPVGWVLCDGNNGTPDLRNRFIVGAGNSYEVGNTGGSDSITLTTAQMPSHSHSASTSTSTTVNTTTTVKGGSSAKTDSAGSHTHTIANQWIGGNSQQIYVETKPAGYIPTYGSLTTDSAGSHTHTISGLTFDATSTSTASSSSSTTVYSNGSSSAHENRPPYYALCYIMKT